MIDISLSLEEYLMALSITFLIAVSYKIGSMFINLSFERFLCWIFISLRSAFVLRDLIILFNKEII